MIFQQILPIGKVWGYHALHISWLINFKSEYLNTLWITKELRKSSKRKHRLYDKYLKIRSKEKKKTCKT